VPLHLGPLGALRTLRGPRTDIQIEFPRQGGTHVALSGAHVVDYLGSAGSFAFTWRHLPADQADYLDALRDRHVRGPLRFVLDGWKRNRLSRSAASLGYGGRDLTGVAITSGYTEPARSWPDQAPPAGLGLRWVNWTPGSAVRLDRDRPVPVLAGEAITCSVWAWSSHTDTVRLIADYRTAEGYTDSAAGGAVTLTAGTWQRLVLTRTPPATTWGVSLAVMAVDRSASDSVLVLAAAQCEAATSASAWSLGGGAPQVAVDSAPLKLPRAGYVDPELTLLEV